MEEAFDKMLEAQRRFCDASNAEIRAKGVHDLTHEVCGGDCYGKDVRLKAEAKQKYMDAFANFVLKCVTGI